MPAAAPVRIDLRMHVHGVALLCVLWLPLLGTLLVRVGKVRRAWERSRPADRLALRLLAVTAAVHAGLVFDHGHDAVTATLFLLDAAALTCVIAAGLAGVRGWRSAAALLLISGLGAYAAYVAGGLESLDVLGLATKAVELVALGIVVRGESRQWGRWTQKATATARTSP